MSASEPFVAVREHSLVVYLDEECVLRFDLDGRWFSASLGETIHRRSLDHRVLASPRPKRKAPEGTSIWLDANAAADVSRRVHELARKATEDLTAGRLGVRGDGDAAALAKAIERTCEWTESRYAEHAALFRATYGSIPVLPPDQYVALVVQVVRGCAYNRCTFCTLYRDVPYHVRSGAELDAHLARIEELFGRSLAMRRGVFLGDANALALATDELEDRLDRIRAFCQRSAHPGLAQGGVAAFQDSFTRRRRSADDYAALRRAGLERVYIGLESAHDPTRALLDKPGTAADVQRFLTDVKDSGLAVALMVLVGAGGRASASDHFDETVAFLRRLSLDRRDRVFLSALSVAPDAPYAERMAREGLVPLTPEELVRQADAFRGAVNAAGGPVVGRYRLADFVPY